MPSESTSQSGLIVIISGSLSRPLLVLSAEENPQAGILRTLGHPVVISKDVSALTYGRRRLNIADYQRQRRLGPLDCFLERGTGRPARRLLSDSPGPEAARSSAAALAPRDQAT